MKKFDIDLCQVYSADEFHKLLDEVLPLPEYYGGTLDALKDVLTDQPEGWEITFTGCAEAEAILGKYVRSLKKMCEKVSKDNENLTVIFID